MTAVVVVASEECEEGASGQGGLTRQVLTRYMPTRAAKIWEFFSMWKHRQNAYGHGA